MSNNIIETLDGEATNLALHVQLCEQRYLQLISKFDSVDQNLRDIHNIITDIRSRLDTENTTKLRTYLTWAGVSITALMGAVLHLVTR